MDTTEINFLTIVVNNVKFRVLFKSPTTSLEKLVEEALVDYLSYNDGIEEEEALQWIKSKKIRVKGLSNSDKVIIKAKWSVSESGLKSGDLLFVHLGEDHQTLGEISQSSESSFPREFSESKSEVPRNAFEKEDNCPQNVQTEREIVSPVPKNFLEPKKVQKEFEEEKSSGEFPGASGGSGISRENSTSKVEIKRQFSFNDEEEFSPQNALWTQKSLPILGRKPLDPPSKEKSVEPSEGSTVNLHETKSMDSNFSVSRNPWLGFTNVKFAAQNGDPDAQFFVGKSFEKGFGVEKDVKKAFDWYIAAESNGNMEACFSVGQLLADGMGIPIDEVAACDWFEKAADAGHSNAQLRLAFHLFWGHGIKKDVEKAHYWGKRGLSDLQNQDPSFLYSAGQCYYYGIGVDKNLELAYNYFRTSANNSFPPAWQKLGEIFLRDRSSPMNNDKEALRYFEMASNVGFPAGQNSHGECLRDGIGLKKCLPEAFNMFERASQMGHSVALNNLGNCYSRGEGTVKNLQKAAHFWKLAADKGNVYAQYNLGISFRDGSGVPQNIDSAFDWLIRASKQSDIGKSRDAEAGLKLLTEEAFKECKGGSKERRQVQLKAIERLNQVADEGFGFGHYYLGMCFLHGWGVALDLEKAQIHFQKGAERGHKGSTEKLKSLTCEFLFHSFFFWIFWLFVSQFFGLLLRQISVQTLKPLKP